MVAASRISAFVPFSLLSLCSVLLFTSTAVSAGYRAGERLLFADEFDELNNEVWEHEITLGGGGNWEFQVSEERRFVP
jgi:hypothetical protein